MSLNATSVVGLVLAVALAVGLAASVTVSPPAASSAEPVTVLAGFGVQFMQVYVADREKLFEKEGVPVTMKYSTSGKVAVDGMVAGAGVMAISGVFGAVSAASIAPVYIVAPLSIEDGDTKLIVRPGIQSAGDLKGKRVGYQLGTDGHLFMIRYLEKNKLAPGDVVSQNVPAEGLVAAFARGDLDAVAVWEPVAGKARAALAGARVLADKGVVPIYNPVSMRKDFAEGQPETARKLLKALVAANDFIKRNPDRAAEHTAAIGKMDVAEVKSLMATYTYDMTINPAFYEAMDAVAGFLAVSSITKQKADPRKFVYDRLLREVSPALVK
jgi:NitT/TauT family transport system substrate-binding protein